MWSEICQKCPLNIRKCVGVWGFLRPHWGAYSAPQTYYLEEEGCSTPPQNNTPQWSPPYNKILATPMAGGVTWFLPKPRARSRWRPFWVQFVTAQHWLIWRRRV